jgi:2-amino-4-hydroxy-6-hydroxymethyldihydropteridine diphosphokinase
MGTHLVTAAVALGSNLEPKFDALQRAVDLLSSLPAITALRVAHVYIAKAVPVPGVAIAPGDDYLNTAVTFQTALPPIALLDALKSIEHTLGRDQTLHPHGAPRPIDLDLLLLGHCTLTSSRLTIPHPRLSQRIFVLQPLCDLIPFANIPGEHRTIRQAFEHALLTQGSSLLLRDPRSLTITP